jgi:hypothetical protein
MNRKNTFAVLAVFAILFGIAQAAGAAIPNHFTTTDGDSDVINWNIGGQKLNDGWYFGVYDYGSDPSSGLNLLFGSGTTFQSAEFSVTQPSGTDWEINVLSGDFTGNTLTIGNSDDFSFFFWDGSNYVTDFTITYWGADAYNFDSAGGNIMGDDLNPVPLTSSAILFFSGFAGLMAFGSRKKIRK